MWVTKILISPVKKKGFSAQKRPNLAQNWHFWSIWARPSRLIQCPVVGRLVVVARGLYLARHLFTLLMQSLIYHAQSFIKALPMRKFLILVSGSTLCHGLEAYACVIMLVEFQLSFIIVLKRPNIYNRVRLEIECELLPSCLYIPLGWNFGRCTSPRRLGRI